MDMTLVWDGGKSIWASVGVPTTEGKGPKANSTHTSVHGKASHMDIFESKRKVYIILRHCEKLRTIVIVNNILIYSSSVFSNGIISMK